MTEAVQFSKTVRSFMDVFMHRSMRGWGHFAKNTGLSIQQFSLIMQLHHRGGTGISDISERFEITNAAASQMVDKLFQLGYLERIEDPHDRRAKLLSLSAKGKQLIEQSIEERYRWVDQLSENLSAKDREKISDALTIMTEAASKMDQSQ
jgi:DNA-binding MarR family transcriptional regulator